MSDQPDECGFVYDHDPHITYEDEHERWMVCETCGAEIIEEVKTDE